MPESLYDSLGKRKYLTEDERTRFLAVARECEPEVRTLCGVLAYTGCRISEALSLTVPSVDLSAGVIVFESLKKRKKGVFRAVPIPPELLDDLKLIHELPKYKRRKGKGSGIYLWGIERTTAWRHVKSVMAESEISGAAATPKGLRHCFGVTAISKGVPLNLLQRWLGHAQLTTTTIYAEAIGAEERQIAQKMW